MTFRPSIIRDTESCQWNTRDVLHVARGPIPGSQQCGSLAFHNSYVRTDFLIPWPLFLEGRLGLQEREGWVPMWLIIDCDANIWTGRDAPDGGSSSSGQSRSTTREPIE